MVRRVEPQRGTHIIVGLFDVHVPEHDPRAWKAVLSWIEANEPDEIIIGGDFMELESCSRHGGVAQPKMLMEEIEAGRGALRELRSIAPDARIVYIEGNHEDRLSRITVDSLPTFEGAITLPAMLQLHDLGIEWVPYSSSVQRGKLLFVHGIWCNEHHAAKHLRSYGCSVTYGHTHRPQVFTRSTMKSSIQGAFAMPCLRTLDPGWIKGVPQGWAQGIGIYEIMPDGNFTAHQIIMADGKFAWNGRVYG